MKSPIYVRPLNEAEETAVAAGFHSADAFTLRRCQIIRASVAGRQVPQIARDLGCDQQTVRNAIHAFTDRGVAVLTKGSSRAHTIHAAFTAETGERLRELLHHSPREFGHPTSLWTLDLAAQEAYRQGLTDHLVPGETVRATLVRLGVRWLRAKTWITSPDPAYTRNKGNATACAA